MKKKFDGKMSLVILSILLGTLLSIQMKRNIDDYDLVSLKSIQLMKNEVDNVHKEISDLNKLIDKKKKELKDFEDALDDNGDAADVLQKEIDETKLLAGLEDVQGPGIRVIVADNADREIIGSNINEDIIHDSDIQIILNDLRRAGAEAISINGQRVLSRSEVKCGGPIIRINNRSSANPFVITAIGDPKVLYAAINAPNSHGWILREVYKIKVETVIKDNVYVPKYYWTGSNFKYAKPIKEGE
ncbi:DUF881 domain-containing protein [Brassicibacter mesophilus]|uniref:DUF881 domain-containing protein n=1 Tax=Brassicibacter mesophilus TaxID=745119 RepID=UPI003D239CD0